MAPQNQLIGIIEMDADPVLEATLDDSFEATLRQIRCSSVDLSVLDLGSQPPCYSDSFCFWDEDEEVSSDCVVMTANLRQLHTDLENELAEFIDRLLAAS